MAARELEVDLAILALASAAWEETDTLCVMGEAKEVLDMCRIGARQPAATSVVASKPAAFFLTETHREAMYTVVTGST